MKKLQLLIISAFAIIGIGVLPAVVAVPAFAASPADSIKQGTDSIGGGESQPTLEQGIKDVVNVLLFVLGAIAVIMIIIGGIRYTTSNGDASSIKGAKDTILYSVVGLVVAILAYAIVNFVIDAFGGGK